MVKEQVEVKEAVGNALIGTTNTKFAATRSLAQLQKGCRIQLEVWRNYATIADGFEKGSYEHFQFTGYGFIALVIQTIAYCVPEINDVNGSGVIEWHGSRNTHIWCDFLIGFSATNSQLPTTSRITIIVMWL